jgi:hypothetical protein
MPWVATINNKEETILLKKLDSIKDLRISSQNTRVYLGFEDKI